MKLKVWVKMVGAVSLEPLGKYIQTFLYSMKNSLISFINLIAILPLIIPIAIEGIM